MQPSNFDRLSYRLAMLSCGTVRMAANTPCAICGSSGVDMAVRNGGETFAYHGDCFDALLREMGANAAKLLRSLALRQAQGPVAQEPVQGPVRHG